MNNLTDLIDRYIAMWNETDGERRREIIARVWTRNASYVDPVLQGEGQAEIDAMVQSLQQRFPGHKFRRTGAVDVSTGHDCHLVRLGQRAREPFDQLRIRADPLRGVTHGSGADAVFLPIILRQR